MWALMQKQGIKISKYKENMKMLHPLELLT